MPNRISMGRTNQPACRAPSDEEGTRIDRCFERFGRTPKRVVGSLAVASTGRGYARTLAVSRAFLDRVDDDTLAVALAQADERGRRRYFWWFAWFGTWAALVVLAISYTLGGLLPTEATTAGLWLVMLLPLSIALWRMKRTTVAADRFAVQQLGADTVAAAYRTVGQDLTTVKQDLDGSSWAGRVFAVGPFEPPMHFRIRWIETGRFGDRADGST